VMSAGVCVVGSGLRDCILSSEEVSERPSMSISDALFDEPARMMPLRC